MSFPYRVSVILILLIFIGCNKGKQDHNGIDNKSTGEVKYDPDRFPPPPDSIPFDLNMTLRRDTSDSGKTLNMQLFLHNPSEDTVFLSTGALEEPYFDFIITDQDNMQIWSRLQFNVRGQAKVVFTLAPGDTQRFHHKWDYTSYEGDQVDPGKYVVFGGMEDLNITDRDFQNEIKELGNVGAIPETLVIE